MTAPHLQQPAVRAQSSMLQLVIGVVVGLALGGAIGGYFIYQAVEERQKYVLQAEMFRQAAEATVEAQREGRKPVRELPDELKERYALIERGKAVALRINPLLMKDLPVEAIRARALLAEKVLPEVVEGVRNARPQPVVVRVMRSGMNVLDQFAKQGLIFPVIESYMVERTYDIFSGKEVIAWQLQALTQVKPTDPPGSMAASRNLSQSQRAGGISVLEKVQNFLAHHQLSMDLNTPEGLELEQATQLAKAGKSEEAAGAYKVLWERALAKQPSRVTAVVAEVGCRYAQLQLAMGKPEAALGVLTTVQEELAKQGAARDQMVAMRAQAWTAAALEKLGRHEEASRILMTLDLILDCELEVEGRTGVTALGEPMAACGNSARAEELIWRECIEARETANLDQLLRAADVALRFSESNPSDPRSRPQLAPVYKAWMDHLKSHN